MESLQYILAAAATTITTNTVTSQPFKNWVNYNYIKRQFVPRSKRTPS